MIEISEEMAEAASWVASAVRMGLKLDASVAELFEGDPPKTYAAHNKSYRREQCLAAIDRKDWAFIPVDLDFESLPEGLRLLYGRER